jgi:hypothetical protein
MFLERFRFPGYCLFFHRGGQTMMRSAQEVEKPRPPTNKRVVPWQLETDAAEDTGLVFHPLDQFIIAHCSERAITVVHPATLWMAIAVLALLVF